jgi:Cu+-exporting ATPase
MKKSVLAALLVACLSGGCGPQENVNETATPTPPTPPAVMATPAPAEPAKPEVPTPAIDVATLAMKLDPVCKMSLEEYPATSTAEHAGKSYGFCSDFCKRKFVEAPEAILARFAETAPADEAKP